MRTRGGWAALCEGRGRWRSPVASDRRGDDARRPRRRKGGVTATAGVAAVVVAVAVVVVVVAVALMTLVI